MQFPMLLPWFVEIKGWSNLVFKKVGWWQWNVVFIFLWFFSVAFDREFGNDNMEGLDRTEAWAQILKFSGRCNALFAIFPLSSQKSRWITIALIRDRKSCRFFLTSEHKNHLSSPGFPRALRWPTINDGATNITITRRTDSKIALSPPSGEVNILHHAALLSMKTSWTKNLTPHIW